MRWKKTGAACWLQASGAPLLCNQKSFDMKTIRIITCLFLLGLVAASCNKDVLEPIDAAADALSAEAAKAALSEAERAFFDFDFAALNHAALANDPVGREGSLWVDKALEHILLQNHEHRFVPDLIGRIGYPVWSRAMQVDVDAACPSDGKACCSSHSPSWTKLLVQAVSAGFFHSQ
jgi:hypothetical protein